jgi:dihydroorotate dehydrogenase (NAD+) catalytic subunit
MDLQVELAPRHKSGLLLRNPVMTAAGSFGYGIEYGKLAEAQRLGAIVSQGTTLHARTLKGQPRTVEVASGLLYVRGFPNPGIRVVVERYAPQWESWETSVIVNIAGELVEDLVAIAERLEGVAGISGIEVNLEGLENQTQESASDLTPAMLEQIVVELRRATTLPLIIKLPHGASDLPEMALAAATGGADAICLIGSLPGLKIDLRTRRPALAVGFTGLSGPAIKPIALRAVWDVARVLRASRFASLPLIGSGGIGSAGDALEFLFAGASAVQPGIAYFINPHVGVEILEGIEGFCQQEGIGSLKEIVGAAL